MDENQLFQAYRQTHDVRLRNEIAEKYHRLDDRQKVRRAGR